MTEPSKVIHVRNVGHEISENDLLQLFQPFGVKTKLVMLRAKNQALLQMQDVPSAVNALQFYANVQPSIRDELSDLVAELDQVERKIRNLSESPIEGREARQERFQRQASKVRSLNHMYDRKKGTRAASITTRDIHRHNSSTGTII